MRKLVVAVAILGSSLFNNTFAKGDFSIGDKLEEVVKFNKNELALSNNKTEFVKVSFKINEAGEIEVLEMNYSNEEIKKQLLEKLSKIKVNEGYDSEEVYNYNFIFKKL
tara:strand:+ start:2255 stop:2581 length:327 start_codon:yes stop_codon:yes gene_type:complete